MTTCEAPVTNEIPPSPARRELAGHGPASREPSAPGHAPLSRAPLSRTERVAAGTAAMAAAGLAGYGFATHSPSTVGYVSSVLVIAAAVMGLRRAVLPPLLA